MTRSNQKGAILIILIVIITMLSALSMGVLFMTTTATQSELNANNSNRAQYLAEGGIRFARIGNFPDPTDQTFTLSNGEKIRIVISGTNLECTGTLNEGTAFEAQRKIASTIPSPPVNNPPVFTKDPINKPDAVVAVPYTGQTLAGEATDPDGDPLTYSKVSGPGWLNIAPNGDLSGTPGVGDNGVNQWVVEVSDGRGGTDQATLKINVKKK